MNKKSIGLVLAVFVLVAVITLLVIGLTKPTKTNTSNTAPDNTANAVQPQNNTANTVPENTVDPGKTPENTVDPGKTPGSTDIPEGTDKVTDKNGCDEVINVKTARAEFNFYITYTDTGFYMDIERVSSDGKRTGYYITGLSEGYFYSTRDIINPEQSEEKNFYLPNTYMNEGIVFGKSTPEDHAACFIRNEKTHSDITIRAVNIDLGTLFDVLDMTIDFEETSKKAKIKIETADAYVKGEINDEQKEQMTWLAIDNARLLFPDLKLDDVWERYVFKTVLIDLTPYPYHANVYETRTNIPHFMIAEWPGTWGHMYAVNIYMNYYGYMTVYMDEGGYLSSQVEITDPSSVEDREIMDYAYSPVCTRDANSVVPLIHKQANADTLLRRYKKQ